MKSFSEEQRRVISLRVHAKQGNIQAQNDLAFVYLKGIGVAPNYNEAIRWWKIAVTNGSDEAQAHLEDFFIQQTQEGKMCH